MPAGNAPEITALIKAYNGDRHAALQTRRKRFGIILAITAVVIVWIIYAMTEDGGARELLLLSGRRRRIPLFVIGPLAILVFGWLWAVRPERKLQRDLRACLFPLIFAHLDGFAYTNQLEPPVIRMMPRKVVGFHIYRFFDDCLAGLYRGVAVEISEVRLARRSFWFRGTVTLFRGLSIAFPLGDRPDSQIAVRPSRLARPIVDAALPLSRFTRIATGTRSFDSAFDVYAEAPDKVRNYVTQRILPAMQWMQEAWPHGRPRLSVAEGHAFLLLPVEDNYFELPPAGQHLDYGRHIIPIIEEVDVLMRTAWMVRAILDGDVTLTAGPQDAPSDAWVEAA